MKFKLININNFEFIKIEINRKVIKVKKQILIKLLK